MVTAAATATAVDMVVAMAATVAMAAKVVTAAMRATAAMSAREDNRRATPTLPHVNPSATKQQNGVRPVPA